MATRRPIQKKRLSDKPHSERWFEKPDMAKAEAMTRVKSMLPKVKGKLFDILVEITRSPHFNPVEEAIATEKVFRKAIENEKDANYRKLLEEYYAKIILPKMNEIISIADQQNIPYNRRFEEKQ